MAFKNIFFLTLMTQMYRPKFQSHPYLFIFLRQGGEGIHTSSILNSSSKKVTNLQLSELLKEQNNNQDPSKTELADPLVPENKNQYPATIELSDSLNPENNNQDTSNIELSNLLNNENNESVFGFKTLIKTCFNTLVLFFNRILVTGKQSLITNYKVGFILPFILSSFGLEAPPEIEPTLQYTFYMALLNSFVLLSFLNIMVYVSSVYLINKYRSYITEKYPRLGKWLNYYSSFRVSLIIVETILTLLLLLFIIIFNIYFTSSIIYDVN